MPRSLFRDLTRVCCFEQVVAGSSVATPRTIVKRKKYSTLRCRLRQHRQRARRTKHKHCLQEQYRDEGERQTRIWWLSNESIVICFAVFCSSKIPLHCCYFTSPWWLVSNAARARLYSQQHSGLTSIHASLPKHDKQMGTHVPKSK